jgi:hypothetical protein
MLIAKYTLMALKNQAFLPSPPFELSYSLLSKQNLPN